MLLKDWMNNKIILFLFSFSNNPDITKATNNFRLLYLQWSSSILFSFPKTKGEKGSFSQHNTIKAALTAEVGWGIDCRVFRVTIFFQLHLKFAFKSVLQFSFSVVGVFCVFFSHVIDNYKMITKMLEKNTLEVVQEVGYSRSSLVHRRLGKR